MNKLAVIFSLIVWILGSQISIAETYISEEIQVFEMEDLDKEPKPIKRIIPDYPKKEKKERINAHLQLEFIVDTSGNVLEPTISEVRAGKGPDLRNSEDYETLHEKFSQATLEAIAQWKYEPGIKDEAAVRTRIKLPVSFRIKR